MILDQPGWETASCMFSLYGLPLHLSIVLSTASHESKMWYNDTDDWCLSAPVDGEHQQILLWFLTQYDHHYTTRSSAAGRSYTVTGASQTRSWEKCHCWRHHVHLSVCLCQIENRWRHFHNISYWRVIQPLSTFAVLIMCASLSKLLKHVWRNEAFRTFKDKHEVVRVHAKEAYRGSGGIVPLVLNVGTVQM